MYICNSTAGKAETDDSWCSPAMRPSQVSELWIQRRPLLKVENDWERHPISTPGFHMHTYAYVPSVHVWTCAPVVGDPELHTCLASALPLSYVPRLGILYATKLSFNYGCKIKALNTCKDSSGLLFINSQRVIQGCLLGGKDLGN